MDTSTLRQDIQSLVEKFDRDKYHYLSKDYLEAQTRKDFIDPLFEALGWDISNKAGLPPFEREVLLEKGETSGRPDYNFRLGGASKFFVEAKAPPESLDSVRHVLQAKSYAWNTKEVFIVVLTDFEGLRVFDASLPPDRKTPLQGLIIDLKYTEYLNNLDKLLLLSKEAVSQGSLERLLLKDAKSKRQRIPVDKKFLQDMGLWREGLAKDVYRHDPEISVRTLNEVVQKLLDRIVFIRIAEDRKIIAPRTLFEIAQLWKAEGKKRPIQYHLNNLFREINADLNGDIFKSPHACEQYEIDSALLSEIIEDLYFPNSPYLFDVIGVELLGSIYERYLGSTIRATPGGRVKVEEKPEVRKAGGVYYTPQYIVKYIVENTVGKLIEGKTPKQIEKIKILDPACGSGSFLLGAYQYLIDYHIKYYREHPKEAHAHPLFPDLIGDQEGRGDPAGRPHRLSIIKKGHILRNNLFGVDIDPQAVEITMMSLYLKALEGERTLPRKQGLLPVLSDNIKCGNSLIGYDVFEPCRGTLQRAPTKGQDILVGVGLPHPHITDEERERINPFDWNSRKAGFGEIMERGGFDCVIGNPPWGAEFLTSEKKYLMAKYERIHMRTPDSFNYFLGAGINFLRNSGLMAMIIPNNFLFQHEYAKSREYFIRGHWLLQAINLGDGVFDVTAPSCIIVVAKNSLKSGKLTSIVDMRNVERESLSEQIENIAFEKIGNKEILKLPDNIIPMDKKATNLISRILTKYPTLLGNLSEEVAAGIGTGGDKIFRIENKAAKGLSIEKDILHPVLVGRDIEAFYTPEHSSYSIIYSTKAISAKTHPKTLEYLKPFQTKLSQKRETRKGLIPWWSLHWPRYHGLFKSPKIILRQTADSLYASIDTKGYYCLNSIIIARPKSLDNIFYLMGLLNSKLLRWLYKNLTQESERVFAEVKPINLRKLPIRTINFDNPKEKAMHDKLVNLVDRMLELQKKRHALPATSGREVVEREIAVTDERIDDLVYELYGITKGERAIIEGTDRK